MFIRVCLSAILAMLLLTGCSREQKNTDMVMNKEVVANFTMQPETAAESASSIPMLPGKAQILGAPFEDFQTQTGSATVLPSQNKTIEVPNTQ